MDVASPSQPSPLLASALASGDYRLDQEGAPKPYKPAADAEVRATVLEVLANLAHGHLSTVTADGWPVGCGVRYVSLDDGTGRPVIYLISGLAQRELVNIDRDSRVSFEAHYAVGFERRREAKGVQLQGVASLVSDEQELAFVSPQAQAKYNDPEVMQRKQVARIDVLSAVVFNASGRPQWGQFDYFAQQDG
ncbi:pyridoxamine 5'-phosphate oxidase family protein [Novosphingobium sp. RL4]|uniref:pyridoxamine 5'-phosphate oxidase family protein n=1 Tax=Novosphingobium sp. RL4 TaxID=3109595 RepID=UPI002D79AF62|nr:pyridoxamine 5'-phosphate oxidase family protein [Novosphingobium sp. RL4]WRT94414.1 pyridoxamine 5'-phosphate oxidase family protein [Novosphingobium sp. RL4]